MGTIRNSYGRVNLIVRLNVCDKRHTYLICLDAMYTGPGKLLGPVLVNLDRKCSVIPGSLVENPIWSGYFS